MNNFELFEEGDAGRMGERMHVTLNKECRLYFSARALAALGDPDAVALLFDQRQQVIGVMPSVLGRKHAYRLRLKERTSHSRLILAKNFCKHHGIRPTETLEFPTAAVNNDGILVLDLHRANPVSRPKVTSGK